MSERPEVDLLSDFLRSCRMRAHIFKQGAYSGRWALDARGVKNTVFHLIGRGQAWVHVDGREPMPVRGGDLVLFPVADWHQLTPTPQRRSNADPGGAAHGPFTTVLCAMVEFDVAGGESLMASLPPVVVVRSEDRAASAELHALARLMLAEFESGSPGRQGVLDRLAEVMFVLVLRHYMQEATGLEGMLAALKDDRVARALLALHRDPGGDWGVDALAREAGMSRTVFAERFTRLLGRTPMQYVTAWRMHLADTMLRSRRSSVAQVAERFGYQTEAAFRRTFRRVRGVGPGEVRREGREA